MYGITKKDTLALILQKMLDNFPKDFNFFPKTWNVPYQLMSLKSDMAENKRKARE